MSIIFLSFAENNMFVDYWYRHVDHISVFSIIVTAGNNHALQKNFNWSYRVKLLMSFITLIAADLFLFFVPKAVQLLVLCNTCSCLRLLFLQPLYGMLSFDRI